MSDDLRDLWQSQSTAAFRMSPDEIRSRIEQVSAKARRRNQGGVTVCVFLIVGCLWFLMFFDNLLPRIGVVLTMAGVGFMLYQILSNQREERTTVTTIDAHKAQLERQRDFHRGRKFWSRLLLFVPGPLLLFAGFAQEHPEVLTMIRIELVTFIILAIAAVPLNLWMARRYQHQLDEIQHLQQENP